MCWILKYSILEAAYVLKEGSLDDSPLRIETCRIIQCGIINIKGTILCISSRIMRGMNNINNRVHMKYVLLIFSLCSVCLTRFILHLIPENTR
jgi:hypothetical protein